MGMTNSSSRTYRIHTKKVPPPIHLRTELQKQRGSTTISPTPRSLASTKQLLSDHADLEKEKGEEGRRTLMRGEDRRGSREEERFGSGDVRSEQRDEMRLGNEARRGGYLGAFGRGSPLERNSSIPICQNKAAPFYARQEEWILFSWRVG
jgi:hypothetical protein